MAAHMGLTVRGYSTPTFTGWNILLDIEVNQTSSNYYDQKGWEWRGRSSFGVHTQSTFHVDRFCSLVLSSPLSPALFLVLSLLKMNSVLILVCF